VDKAINRNFAVGSGARILDTGDIRLGRTYAEKERAEVIDVLEAAIRRFVSDVNSYKLIPQVGSNIVFSAKGRKTCQMWQA